ncbi:polysaccharide deacetylase family protein [Consotaella salsifontis]|uniref:polysaccharide deacetylase family protein n=1 Tax=Consotaella salsifontis TaxID=1365950 RepID=UPI001FDA99FD|nr:polysaccharide deacetylase family protein [Consotaella salsifontis]
MALCFAGAGIADAGQSHRLVEPKLHIATGGVAHPQVALTFDACSGATDPRILSALIDNRIPATIFVTERWLKRNKPALETMLSHPDLFEIENHGAKHIPAVDVSMSVFGLAAAGSTEAVDREVDGGAEAVQNAGAPAPHWFRGATAKYTSTSIAEIRRLGFRVAGYSVNGDEGALASEKAARSYVARAKDGDVVIAHINQPGRAAGAGVAAGILSLKDKGYRFVRLDDAEATGTDGTTRQQPGF